MKNCLYVQSIVKALNNVNGVFATKDKCRLTQRRYIAVNETKILSINFKSLVHYIIDPASLLGSVNAFIEINKRVLKSDFVWIDLVLNVHGDMISISNSKVLVFAKEKSVVYVLPLDKEEKKYWLEYENTQWVFENVPSRISPEIKINEFGYSIEYLYKGKQKKFKELDVSELDKIINVLCQLYMASGFYYISINELIRKFKKRVNELEGSVYKPKEKLFLKINNLLNYAYDYAIENNIKKIEIVHRNHGDMFVDNNVIFFKGSPILIDWEDSSGSLLMYDVVFMVMMDQLSNQDMVLENDKVIECMAYLIDKLKLDFNNIKLSLVIALVMVEIVLNRISKNLDVAADTDRGKALSQQYLLLLNNGQKSIRNEVD